MYTGRVPKVVGPIRCGNFKINRFKSMRVDKAQLAGFCQSWSSAWNAAEAVRLIRRHGLLYGSRPGLEAERRSGGENLGDGTDLGSVVVRPNVFTLHDERSVWWYGFRDFATAGQMRRFALTRLFNGESRARDRVWPAQTLCESSYSHRKKTTRHRPSF